mmetsp:Transcript_31935/g.65009  ORF Transcript_31935/g.65009 Transcript_31935/m.65009 type:complete len:209 (+) Transcript_31935:226-852(+)
MQVNHFRDDDLTNSSPIHLTNSSLHVLPNPKSTLGNVRVDNDGNFFPLPIVFSTVVLLIGSIGIRSSTVLEYIFNRLRQSGNEGNPGIDILFRRQVHNLALLQFRLGSNRPRRESIGTTEAMPSRLAVLLGKLHEDRPGPARGRTTDIVRQIIPDVDPNLIIDAGSSGSITVTATLLLESAASYRQLSVLLQRRLVDPLELGVGIGRA